jgi:Domain of unknown function (DUF4270)
MKLHKFSWLWVVLIGVIAIGSSCTRATIVGNDLLDDDIKTVGFTDTFRLRARTTVEDSVITHSSLLGPQMIRHAFGNLNDSYLGTTSSELVSQMFLSDFGSEFLDFDVDSVVLSLVYDTAGNYGILSEPVTVEVFRNRTTLLVTQSYFSNEIFMRDPEPIGEKRNFIPDFVDSVRIDRPGDTTFVAAHLRIPLSDEFIEELKSQTPGTFSIDDSFMMWFQGVHVVLSEGENTILGVKLNDSQSGMTIYYSAADSSLYKSYQFIFTGRLGAHVQVATFEHNYMGSGAEEFIDDWDKSDSLTFIQSFSGLNTEFEIVGLEELEDVLINQAILEFYVADLADDDRSFYPETKRIQTRTMNSLDRLINSRDVNLAIGAQDLSLFGGDLTTDGDGIKMYSMNITASVQDIVQGRAENSIFLSSFLKQNDSRRVILYGPGHPDFPARLKIIFTKTR